MIGLMCDRTALSNGSVMCARSVWDETITCN